MGRDKPLTCVALAMPARARHATPARRAPRCVFPARRAQRACARASPANGAARASAYALRRHAAARAARGALREGAASARSMSTRGVYARARCARWRARARARVRNVVANAALCHGSACAPHATIRHRHTYAAMQSSACARARQCCALRRANESAKCARQRPIQRDLRDGLRIVAFSSMVPCSRLYSGGGGGATDPKMGSDASLPLTYLAKRNEQVLPKACQMPMPHSVQ